MEDNPSDAAAIMSSPWICAVRSVALDVPDLRRALAFYTEVWRLELALRTEDAIYLRGGGADHYLLALHEGVGAACLRHVTLRARSEAALGAVADAAVRAGGEILQTIGPVKDDPAGGIGLSLRDPDGRVYRVVYGDTRHEVTLDHPDCPTRLAHVVLNCKQRDAAQRFVEQAFGFVLADLTRLMAFMNCNSDHHSLALAAADNDALNHIAFLQPTLDAVMRGGGRMRDHGYSIEWGPGRHGPGNNAFNYFIDPFGIVIEYTAEVEQIDDEHKSRGPEDWAWPAGRLDHWGIGVGPTPRLKEAQQQVVFAHSHVSERKPSKQ